jgi:hypothetical protein
MATKYSKYIVTHYEQPQGTNAWSPAYRPQDRTRILRLDEGIIQGAKLYVGCVWFWPKMLETSISDRSTKPHSHDYDEVLGLIGTNPDDPHDLGGESEVTIGGETHYVNKSCLIYIPAGLEHGPFRETRMERPIFHFECRSSGARQ